MGDDRGDPNANALPKSSTGDPQLDAAVLRWLAWDKNARTRSQVESLLAAGQVEQLRSRLCGCRLSFGTAGLRAPMGAGFNRINDLTVIQSTQGLHSYLLRTRPDLASEGVVVGFDGRGQRESACSSRRLAALTAAVLLSRDVPVHLFGAMVPTPFVPYAVKKLAAAAGVMVTASHNPREDNGYKVYWSSGAQICWPHEREILRCVEAQLEPWSAACWDESLAERSPLRTDPLLPITGRYMEEVASLCFHRSLNSRCGLRFVHSSFHGVGHAFVRQAFAAFGFLPPIPVPEQRDPDPDFPTVPCPNPEEGLPVLELPLRLAEREDARVVMATDPDADRLAVAERSADGSWKVFSGNELAALLAWWMFFNWKRSHPDPSGAAALYMLATCVSSKILRAMARAEGFQFEETLPGFKWVGNRIHELSQEGKTVLFAFEESIGFLCGSLVPEKDGVSSAAVVAEMSCYLQNQGLTLARQLLRIYQTYGFHLASTSYVTCTDPRTVRSVFTGLRNYRGSGSYPAVCGGVPIVQVRDVTTGYDSGQPDRRSVLPVTRSSQMITFTLQNGVTATLRASGTEPKIKFYTELCAAPGQSDVRALEEELQRASAALVDDFLEPERNHLIRRQGTGGGAVVRVPACVEMFVGGVSQ
ncbi:glucose 1,6-bisphosphate synthase isoform 1-T1 [Synchiropus picturatus]